MTVFNPLSTSRRLAFVLLLTLLYVPGLSLGFIQPHARDPV